MYFCAYDKSFCQIWCFIYIISMITIFPWCIMLYCKNFVVQTFPHTEVCQLCFLMLHQELCVVIRWIQNGIPYIRHRRCCMIKKAVHHKALMDEKPIILLLWGYSQSSNNLTCVCQSRDCLLKYQFCSFFLSVYSASITQELYVVYEHSTY